MVRALTIRFDSREFPNPHIQRHYDMLQTLALDRDKLENVKDLIGPDVEGLLSAQDKIHAFRDVVCFFFIVFFYLFFFCSFDYWFYSFPSLVSSM